jgi:hypothetical protein
MFFMLMLGADVDREATPPKNEEERARIARRGCVWRVLRMLRPAFVMISRGILVKNEYYRLDWIGLASWYW